MRGDNENNSEFVRMAIASLGVRHVIVSESYHNLK